MPMNLIHRKLCSSDAWARKIEEGVLPWALDGLDLGTDVLEIGPGFGATTRVLVRRVPRLTALEVDPASARLLGREFGDRARIVQGDGSAMPLPDAAFDAVVCFTMLHHVPSPALQDRLFAEARRVLRPGGVFTGTDSLTSPRFRLLHIGDTRVEVDPDTLPTRLSEAGFDTTEVVRGEGSFRFRARAED
ncbi:class I SAM-dependent methyltransferase [Streptantibioticus parmotrematis]|uniref:class I SAM-dependent methyltransferase n=1 Tax=Streptantibioticus parmotrematis TaxID=2873249 RepID=UPI0034084808